MTVPISPAAQAALDAAMRHEINTEYYSRKIAAAALRDAAKQQRDLAVDVGSAFAPVVTVAANFLETIANELDPTP